MSMVSIGIDLGGTNIAAGVVDSEGKILSKASNPTLVSRPYEEIVKDMAKTALEALEKSGYSLDDVRSIGIGIPGLADKEGNIVFCTNLGWHDIPIRTELQRYIDKPVYADNDATVAGYAEAMAGVSRGADSSVFLTLGTGVGSCIIINGKIWSGAHGVGGEIGHFIYNCDGEKCTCGLTGCFERYSSATALIRMGRQELAKHPNSLLAAKADTLSARDVIDSARVGDEAACAAFDQYTTHLAMGIISIINYLDPEMIVLGGGVAGAGSFLLDKVVEKVTVNRFYKTLPFGEIKLASLGNDAGIIGAAMLGR